MTQQSGQVGDYAWGRIWAHWAFRVARPGLGYQELRDGLRSYTAFWAAEQGLALDDLQFRVLEKRVSAPRRWEPELLRLNLAAPWAEIGTAEWAGNTFSLRL